MVFFLLSLGICVALVAFSSLETRLPMSKSRILLNPRDIDINMVNKSCNSWSSPYQLSYAIGVGDLVATSLNTFSTFMVHDKSTTTLMNRAVPVKHYLLRLLISANTVLNNALCR